MFTWLKFEPVDMNGIKLIENTFIDLSDLPEETYFL